MKYLIGLLVGWLWVGLVVAQHHVLHVQGQVVLQSTGKAPDVGMELTDKAALSFATKDAQVSLWVTGKGRHLLRWPEGMAFEPGKAMPIAALMQPSKTYPRYPLQPVLRTEGDFKQHFDRRYLLLPGTAVAFDPQIFPLGPEKVFYVRFLQKALNAEVPTRLPVLQDSLLQLDPAQFLNMNGVPVSQADATDFSIYYTENRKNHLWICSFQPVYDQAQLMMEMDLLSDMAHHDKSFIAAKKLKDPEEYYNFLCEAWGIPDYQAFLRWAKMEKSVR